VGNTGPADVADLLINTIDLAFHPNLMAAAGDLAVEQLSAATAGDFVLAVEGGIPTAFNGNTCWLWTEYDSSGNKRDVTALDAVKRLAPQALAVLSVGSCASFGGIPAGAPNPTAVSTLAQAAGVSTINIPGCPPHPDWIVGTIAKLITGAKLELDNDSRPVDYFKGVGTIHENCPRRKQEEAENFGLDGYCLKELGCKGPRTTVDCPTRQWNNGVNWCIGANAVCIGCVETGFPDKFSPFYSHEGGSETESDEHAGTSEGGGTSEHDEKPQSADYKIEKVEWKKDKRILKVEGKSDKGVKIMVRNGSTGKKLISTKANKAEWKLEIRNPSPVPCWVEIEVNNVVSEYDVKNAPGDCK